MEYYCTICNKKYVSYKSLWNHNSKFHKVVVESKNNLSNHVSNQKSNHNDDEKMYSNKNDILKCKKCDKKFTFKQNRWRHEKTCIKNKSEIEEIKNENLEMKKEIDKLRDIIQNSLKIHHQTLKKITKDLSNNNVLINGDNNLTNNNNGTINNNNITYVQLGNEDLINVLSKSEKRGILNRKAMGINDLVELIHCSGKYKQFMNVYITNLQNTVAYRYDKKINNFIVVNKNELLDEIIDARIYDITKFLEEAEKYLEPTMVTDIKRIIKKMETDSFKGLKKEEIKFILYNNKEKIMVEKDTTKEIEV